MISQVNVFVLVYMIFEINGSFFNKRTSFQYVFDQYLLTYVDSSRDTKRRVLSPVVWYYYFVRMYLLFSVSI